MSFCLCRKWVKTHRAVRGSRKAVSEERCVSFGAEFDPLKPHLVRALLSPSKSISAAGRVLTETPGIKCVCVCVSVKLLMHRRARECPHLVGCDLG